MLSHDSIVRLRCLAATAFATFLFGPVLKGSECELYPIALSVASFSNLSPGGVISNIYNGTASGNFGWMSWSGKPSVGALVQSLTIPGDSGSYTNPDNKADHLLSPGDWVTGGPGLGNAREVRDALDRLKQSDIRVPVWSETRGQGSQAAYRVAGFALVRLLDYQLASQNRISARFLGFVTCGALNLPPHVDAGADFSGIFPRPVQLAGSTTDDGLPALGSLVSTWRKISGPGNVTFTAPNLPRTTANLSQPGIYELELAANDGELAGRDSIIITIQPDNRPPRAIDAQLTTLEDSPIDLRLEAIDPDGDALQFKIATPPAFGTLSGTPPNLRYTPGLNYSGEDHFTFQASDGRADSALGQVTLTIVPVNDAPVARALDITTDEDQPVSLTLQAVDPEGDVLTFRIVAPPVHGHLTGAGPDLVYRPDTDFHGTDQFTFAASDATDTSSANVRITVRSVNDPPFVQAGLDQIITWPADRVNLFGLVTDDATPAPITLKILWEKIAGPAEVTFGNGTGPGTAAATVARFSAPGRYQLRLTADDSELSASDELTITVNARPAVDAGRSQTIRLGEAALLTGQVNDDGLPGGTLRATWELAGGPGAVFFDDKNSLTTSARFSAAGDYRLRLLADDGEAANSASVEVKVLPANQAPVIQLRNRLVVRLPDAATLEASINDDGLPRPLTTRWTKSQGPGEVDFADPTGLRTSAHFSQAGTYLLALSAADGELTSSSTITVVVQPANPEGGLVVDAGPDQVIGLTSAAQLSGAITLPAGSGGGPIEVSWEQVSGPGTVTFLSPRETRTEAVFSAQGIYRLRLMAQSGGQAGSAEVTITVYPRNRPPEVAAGDDQELFLPDSGLLAANGFETVDPSQSLSLSLGLVDHWKNEIGQPGLNGPVFANDLSATGEKLYASGEFGLAGGQIVQGLAGWDGAGWFLLSDPRAINPLDPASPAVGFITDPAAPFATALAARGDELFVAGGFLKDLSFGADGHLDLTARWTGQHWERWQFKLVSSAVSCRAINASPDAVYVGGEFIFQPADFTPDPLPGLPVSFNIARWNGHEWSALGEGIRDVRDTADPATAGFSFAVVQAIAAGPDGQVYVGGSFTLQTAHGLAYNIAKWDGSEWQPLDRGLAGCSQFNCQATVKALAIAENGDLYAGGNFSKAGELDVHHLARWDGARWSVVGGPGPDENGVNAPVEALALRGRDLYVAGQFTQAGSVAATRIAKWDGQMWSSLGNGPGNGLDGPVTALALQSGGLTAGGYFENAGGQPANSIARFEFAPLPAFETFLSGHASDDGLPSGAELSLSWSKVSGPGDVQFSAPHAGATQATFSEAGRYILKLTASDSEFTVEDQVTVNARGNRPPTVAAGLDQSIGLTETLQLGGQITDDGMPEGVPLTTAWSVLRGPGSVAFASRADPRTTATFSALGTYILRLSANDSQFTASDDLTVTVLPANQPPQVSIFGSTRVFLPAVLSVSAAVTDDHLPHDALQFAWGQVSGPGRVVFADPCALGTTASFTKPGLYVIALTANDSELSSRSETTVEVVDLRNAPPFVYAGPDLEVAEFENVTLNGFILDDTPLDNLYVVWNVWLAPGPVTLDNPGSSVTSAQFGAPGVYGLTLFAADFGAELFVSDNVLVTVRAAQNQPPSVEAGPPRSISLAQPSLALQGSVSDDGLPAPSSLSATWRMVQGPAPITFANINDPGTTAAFSSPGEYLLELSATDTASSSSAQVSIKVIDPNRGNLPPAVDAGPDQTVTLFHPVTLSGTATDDGLPGLGLDYRWTQVQGPCPVTFAQPSAAQTSVSFQTAGQYILRLSASDKLLMNGDDVAVTVLPAPNYPPFVDAGGAQTLILPANSLTLNGSASDDGFPASSLTTTWTVVSGNPPVTFSDPHALQPVVTFPNAVRGARYTLRLTASDSEFSISKDVIISFGDLTVSGPSVDAGPDQTVTLPEPVALPGKVTIAGGPFHTVNASWSLISGPCLPIFDNVNQAATTAHFPLPGTYRLRLTANDFSLFGGLRLYGSDDVAVEVRAPSNAAPFADAGPSSTILLSDPALNLHGLVADDGVPSPATLEVHWSQVAGPAPVTFDPPGTATARAAFSAPGNYVLRLTASDGALESSSDRAVTVTDSTRGNLPPEVSAGPDQTIDLPGPASLTATVVDDGSPGLGLQFHWSWVSGPGPVAFSDDADLTTEVDFFLPGVYRFRFTANDYSLSNSDDLLVTVRENRGPTVHAGFDQTVFLPETAALTGQIFGAAPGHPASLTWTLSSGPAAVVIDDPAAPSTAAHFSQPGSYTFRLTAVNDQGTGQDEVTIEVIGGSANLPPTVAAGPDQTVSTVIPVVLSGQIQDDGLPSGRASKVYWSQVSGPGLARFANAALAETTVRLFTPGNYVLRLSATDGELTAYDDLVVTARIPANTAPFVSAGPDLQVTRPDAAALLGLVFDDALPAGYPLTIHWSQLAGPGTVSFLPDSTEPFAQASFSKPGIYRLRLTASDSEFEAQDEITVTVAEGINQAPVVTTLISQQVEQGQTASLGGEVSDDGLPGGLLESHWTMVSGPAAINLRTVNGVYQATFDEPGHYLLRLTASDSALTSSADLDVTVVPALQPPEAIITFPIEGTSLTGPAAVLGTANSSVLDSFTVEYRLAGQDPENAWTLLEQGTQPVIQGNLALFDPTLLLNGIYELRLTVRDRAAHLAEARATFVVEGKMKVGNFSLDFQDLSVALGGLPMQIVRRYDSRDKTTGDFGVGWQLELKNIRLQKNRHLGLDWEETSTGGDFPTYCLDPRKPRLVTVTFPDGRVDRFMARADPDCSPLLPIRYPRIQFDPIGKTRSTLVPLTGDEVFFGAPIPGLGDLVDWELLLDPPPGDAGNILFNPHLFQLTTAEGYRFDIDEKEGLQRLTDPNGNTLTITRDGITHSSGKSVQFARDQLGRITNITDLAGNHLAYHYDAAGDLVAFEDQENNRTSFSYNDAHGLLVLEDARGLVPVRNEYDENGRLLRHTDAFGKVVTYTHHLDTRQEVVTDRLGNPTVSEYDDRGNVVQVTHPDGAVQRFTYDARDNLLTASDPLGRTTTYTYDAADNRTSATDPAGQITRATYGPQRRITTITDPRGNVTSSEYDTAGNLLAITDPLGQVSRLAYENGLPTSFTDALGQRTLYGYDTSGNLIRETDPQGHAVTYARDANGNVASQTTTRTTAAGAIETLTARFEYDALGRVTKAIQPDGSSIQTSYNPIGKPAATVDPLGRVTSFDYDALGQLAQVRYPDNAVEQMAYDAQGRVVSSRNRLGQVTVYQYDTAGRQARVEYPDGSTVSNYFDLAGQLIARTDPRGLTTFYGYDLAARPAFWTNALGQVSLSEYDAAGNLRFRSDPFDPSEPNGTSPTPPTAPDSSPLAPSDGERAGLPSEALAKAGVRGTHYEYDELNRLRQIIYADNTAQTYFYDAIGRRIAQTDQAGQPARFGYDAVGRLTSVTDPLGQVTRYQYDELGSLLSQTDANLHTTTFEYDLAGRRTKRTLPTLLGQSALTETYAYDLAGNLTAKTDLAGYTTTYRYDQLNRLLEQAPDPRLAAAGSVAESWTYDLLGQRASMTDAAGVTSYSYDNRNRLISKATPRGTLAYSYDANGNVSSVQSSTPNGVRLSYEYDALNRLAAVRNSSGLICSYRYDASGNLAGYGYANGLTTDYSYHTLKRPIGIRTRSSSLAALYSASYRLDATGNRLASDEVFSLAPDASGDPALSSLAPSDGERAGVRGTTSLSSLAPSDGERVGVRGTQYYYDPLSRLLQEFISGDPANSGTVNYSYDPVGNRLSRDSSLPNLSSATATYDPLDRLTADRYDANGNTIQATLSLPGSAQLATVSDAYDFENRLVTRQSTVNASLPVVRFTYDGDGNRVSKTVNGLTTFYLVDDLNPTGSPQVLEELASLNGQPASLVRRYIYGQGLISQEQAGPSGWSSSFYGYDTHGSVRFLTDPAGAVTDQYHYDAFGNLLSQTGSTPNSYLFSGEQFDTDLGLYYLRARYYHPGSGRFWSSDSFAGSPGSTLHPYLYCANNPVNRLDPSGHFSLTEEMHVSAFAPIVRGALQTSYGRLASGAIGGAMGAADAALHDNDPAMGALFGVVTGYGLGFVPGRILANPAVIIALLSAGGLSVGESLYEGHTAGAIFRGATVFAAAYRAASLAYSMLSAAETTENITLALTEHYFKPRIPFPKASTPKNLVPAGKIQETRTILWSGPGAKDAAAWLANNTGGTTLEMTHLGAQTELATVGMDYLTQAKPIWEAASKQFVQNASGEVTIVLSRSANPSSIYFTTEWKTLLQNPNVTGIKFIHIP